MIQKSFRVGAMGAAQTNVYHKCFKDDQESAESDPLSGMPETSITHENVERVLATINKDE